MGTVDGIVNTCAFITSGLPTPKGSTTRMPNGATVPAGTTESRKRMSLWRDDLRLDAKAVMGNRPPFRGAIRLFVEFAMPVPMSSIRKYQWGWLPHTKKPDVDKLFRALSDALTGIVWVDDSQVCVSAINKVYAWDGRTGASVHIDEINEDAAKRFAQGASWLRDIVSKEPIGQHE